MSNAPAPTPAERSHGALNFAVDFGPLLIFFLTYKFIGSGGIASMITATLVFMVAIVVAIIVGLVVLKRVSPMTWISAILILGFGGLTIYFHDPKFIQLKPTIIYVFFAAMLLAGLARRKAVLRWRLSPGTWSLRDGVATDGRNRLSVSARMPFKRIEIVQGWESRYYQHKEPSPVLEVEVDAAGTLTTEYTWNA